LALKLFENAIEICSEYDIVVDRPKLMFARSRRRIVSSKDIGTIIIAYVVSDHATTELVPSTDLAGYGRALRAAQRPHYREGGRTRLCNLSQGFMRLVCETMEPMDY
jgi:hypothetical protein